MNLDNIVVVLDRPEESRNIGAVCRAMANNSIHTLRIVGKREDIDIERVHILAIHAGYIFDNAEFYSSITEAVSDCAFSAGTTRRRGKKRKGKLLLPEEFAEIADRITGGSSAKSVVDADGEELFYEKKNIFADGTLTKDMLNGNESGANGAKVAVVFGNERTGLEDNEVMECGCGVIIPSSAEFGSLNLSHAVQIMCYHLFRTNANLSRGCEVVDLGRVNSAVGTVTDSLEKIGFFKQAGRQDMEHFWRDVISRAALSEGEVQYLEKVFVKAAGLAGKNRE